MPYKASLHSYILPEFYEEFPESWMTRLREVSPKVEGLAYLHPRWFAPHPHWNHPERGQWALYSATPIRMIRTDRAEQYERHWSEMPTAGQQAGIHGVVSSYQHFMWHTQGIEVKPFLILQGEWGGTPAKYTEREKRFLDASAAMSEPFPLGFFPATPFGEHVVKQITLRDRMIQACNNYDRLEAMDSTEAKKAEDDAAERLFRETYLDTWKVMQEPAIDFMLSAKGRQFMDNDLRPAPEGTANAVAQWREHFTEFGNVPGATNPNTRKIHVAVH